MSSEHDRVEELRMDHGVVRWVIARGSGKRYTHYDCEGRAKTAANAFQRWFARTVKTRTIWNEAEMNQDAIRSLRYTLDGLQSYIEHAQRHLDEIEGTDRRRERIKALRQVSGRTPGETAAFLAKAAALEDDTT